MSIRLINITTAFDSIFANDWKPLHYRRWCELVFYDNKISFLNTLTDSYRLPVHQWYQPTATWHYHSTTQLPSFWWHFVSLSTDPNPSITLPSNTADKILCDCDIHVWQAINPIERKQTKKADLLWTHAALVEHVGWLMQSAAGAGQTSSNWTLLECYRLKVSDDWWYGRQTVVVGRSSRKLVVYTILRIE